MNYLFQMREGWLVGREYNGLPCRECVSLWLDDRKVWHIADDNFAAVRKATDELEAENNVALLFEVSKEGELTRLECRLEKHPRCNCKAKGYVEYPSKKLNYAFSPIMQVKCERYATPSDNVWVAQATHVNGTVTQCFENSREASRTGAVAAMDALSSGTVSKLETLKNEVISKYTEQCKSPMLIVGCNSWVRTKVPFVLLQQFDIHMFFYPNANATWVVGAVAINRMSTTAKPVWSYASAQTIERAMTQALFGLIPVSMEWSGEDKSEQDARLALWFSHWVYRCPKIALRDVLALEAYPENSLAEYIPSKISSVPKIRPVMRVIEGGKQGEADEKRANLKRVK